MKQQHVSPWWQQWTCVGGSCAPTTRPAVNAFEFALDRYTALTAPFLRGCCVFLVVGSVAAASSRIGPVAGLALMSAYLVVHSSYCLANFVRCREAHCVITGAGWLVLAAIAAAAALTGQDFRGGIWIAYTAVTVGAFAFEFLWRAMRGSNVLTFG